LLIKTSSPHLNGHKDESCPATFNEIIGFPIGILIYQNPGRTTPGHIAQCRLVELLRLNLFSYRNLWDWLDNPFQTPPELPNTQLELAF